jgi:hypothetical protein
MSSTHPNTGAYHQRPAPTPESRTLASDPLETPGITLTAPHLIAAALWSAYTSDPVVHRTVNQVVEQALSDSTIRPAAMNDLITDAIHAWWRQERMGLRTAPMFKQWLLSGEQWHYIPMRRDARIRLRELVPWRVTEIVGHHWTDWEKATYEASGEERLTLTPDNTIYIAHDALFGALRGLTPFCTLAFAARRYARFLDSRERVNRLAGTVTGELNFENIADAAATLKWPLDDTGNPIPQPVYLPEEGTIAVTIGQSRFALMVPQVAAGGADPDGQRFYLRAVEAGRLPEYAGGNGRNANVATAQVQYPFAVRFMLGLRDEFENALTETVRLVLTRMARLGLIPSQWTATLPDGRTETETPATATITWSFPEVRELDFQAHFDSIIALVERHLLTDERAVELLGYDPKTDMPSPEERERRRSMMFTRTAPADDGDEGEGEESAPTPTMIEQAVRSAMHGLLAHPEHAATD